MKTIAESGNDYVVKVKNNQPKLLKAIKETVENSVPADFIRTEEKSRGRYEKREISVFNPSENIPDGWPELRLFIEMNIPNKNDSD